MPFQTIRPARQTNKAPQNQSPHWYASPEWWLVIVAIPTLILIWWQARETARAAKAAEANINLVISKERARLRIDLKPLDLAPGKDYYTVDFTVSIYGATTAFIVEAKCSAGEWPTDAVDDPELMDRAMIEFSATPPFPKAISPNATPIEALTFIFCQDDKTRDLLLSEVKAARLFVVVRGFIRYRDVFEAEHETRFRYVWKEFDIYGINMGNWEKCGPAEGNENS